MKAIDELATIDTCEESTASTVTGRYSIFEYLKKNPALAISSTTILITISSFLFRNALALREVRFLNYWNIEPAYAALQNTSQLLSSIILFLLNLFVSSAGSLLFNMANQFSKEARLSIMSIKLCIQNKRQIRRQSRQLRRVDRKINKLQKLKSDVKQIDEMKQEVASTYKKLNEYDILGKHSLRLSWSILRDLIKETSPQLYGCAIALALLSLLYAFCYPIYLNVFEILIVCAALLALFFLFSLVLFCKPFLKNFSEQEAETIIANCEQKRSPIDTSVPTANDLQHGIKNSTLLVFAAHYLLMLLICICMTIYSGWTAAKKQTQFPIIFEENAPYAIVYNNGEESILKEAELNGTRISINLYSQKVVSSANIDYIIMDFETVETCRVLSSTLALPKVLPQEIKLP